VLIVDWTPRDCNSCSCIPSNSPCSLKKLLDPLMTQPAETSNQLHCFYLHDMRPDRAEGQFDPFEGAMLNGPVPISYIYDTKGELVRDCIMTSHFIPASSQELRWGRQACHHTTSGYCRPAQLPPHIPYGTHCCLVLRDM
jgi:hypothetical protein